MGLDCTVRFPGNGLPTWEAIKNRLAQVGELAPLRMVDGMPAFPDEVPDDGWRELRVGTDSGMITIRKSGLALNCIIWGNADVALQAARDRIAWACAVAGNGVVDTPTGELSADAFASHAGIRPS